MVFADELPPPPQTRLRKWTRRIFKTLLVFAVFFGIGIVILSRIGGVSEPLRAGLESTIARTAGGHQARVGVLHGVSFFPYVRVYATDIKLHGTVPPRREDLPVQDVMSIKTIMFSRNFWDMFLSRDRAEGFLFEDINVVAGYLAPHEFSNLTIATDNKGFTDGSPALMAAGRYGEHAFSLLIGIAHEQRGNATFYKPRKGGAPFVLSFGDIRAHGTIDKGRWGGLAITIADLHDTSRDLPPAKGVMTVLRLRESHIKIDLDAGNDKAVFDTNNDGALWNAPAGSAAAQWAEHLRTVYGRPAQVESIAE